MIYLWAIPVAVVGIGVAVVLFRWWQWTQDTKGLGARLSDNWEGWEDGR